jgi:hypothetical protein
MSWSQKEHKAENQTVGMLFVGTALAIAFLVFHTDWIVYLLAGWTVLTTLVHLLARFYHLMEKRQYSNTAGWTPRGRNRR